MRPRSLCWFKEAMAFAELDVPSYYLTGRAGVKGRCHRQKAGHADLVNDVPAQGVPVSVKLLMYIPTYPKVLYLSGRTVVNQYTLRVRDLRAVTLCYGRFIFAPCPWWLL